MEKIYVPARSTDALASVVSPERLSALVDIGGARVRDALAGRGIVNVSSTAVGGGVSELLHVMLPYTRDAGIDASWFVLDGDAKFFEITKRLHHRLHGQLGDGGPLGPVEWAHLAAIGESNASQLAASVVAGDVVVLHDPQPLGMAAVVASWGTPVVWRCHVGTEHVNEHTAQAWSFLRPHLEPFVDAYVFTRREYAPEWLPSDLINVIHPAIDPLSPKNQPMDDQVARDVLRHVGLVDGGLTKPVTFSRSDGAPGRVLHHADIIRNGPPPAPDVPLVVQVSRWDPLKDMSGVMHAFVDHVLDGLDAHLVLAGPVVTSIADDPEAAQVLNRVRLEWMELPHAARSRVQLVCLPMMDSDENGVIVNALQRHATVVVQKSLEEGFGLTVTEAMFKGKAMVASAVGGIRDQITDGVDGLLIDDPTDHAAFGRAVIRLLKDAKLRESLGARARNTVIDKFLPDTSLTQWGNVVITAIDRDRSRRPVDSV